MSILSRAKNKVFVTVLTYLALACWLSLPLRLAAQQANKTPEIAVASAHPLATEAAIKMLQQGGNAFDAAVALTAMLSVVEPYSAGLGGGGFWLLYLADTDESVFIDGRETAPLRARATMYLDENGELIAGSSRNGPLSAGIPGTTAALVYINQNYGELSLKKTLQPAIEVARNGFEVNSIYQSILNASDTLAVMQRYPSSSEIFLADGDIPELGTLIIQPDLANTLTVIAKQGHQGFYTGEVAKTLVEAVRAQGGIWQLEDLMGYGVELREPLQGQYRGIDVISAPLPSAGGIEILTALNILEPFVLQGESDPQTVHQLIEAMRLAYWQASVDLGDPDYVDVDVQLLISKERAAQLRHLIAKDKATPSDSLGKQTLVQGEQNHTTHFSIMDSAGNRVAATFSINGRFGSKFVVPGTGVLLNNTMDDFAAKLGEPNLYGLIGSHANRIQPGKRPLSNMSPTFVSSQDGIGILGAPGGSRIPTMVLLGILGFAAGQSPDTWVSRPRFHHQYLPDLVQYEAGAFSEAVREALMAMGYRLEERLPYGNMQAVFWDKSQNKIYAASDPRGVGRARVEAVTRLASPAPVIPLLIPEVDGQQQTAVGQ